MHHGSCAVPTQAGTPGFRGWEGDNETPELHGFAFDVFSLGACMLFVLDGGAGAHRTVPQGKQVGKEQEVRDAAMTWHYGGATSVEPRASYMIQELVALAVDCARYKSSERLMVERRAGWKPAGMMGFVAARLRKILGT
jgi:hypothetical protein